MSGANTAVGSSSVTPKGGVKAPASEAVNYTPIAFREPPAAELGEGKPDWTQSGQVQWISIKFIRPDPNNPRTSVDRGEMNLLIEDIRDNGFRQPLRIRQGETELDCMPFGGHRRLYAAQQLGKTHLPCIVYTGNFADEQVLMELLLDNEHREALPPIDKAKAFKNLMERGRWTATELARRMHLDPQLVVSHLSLLELPPSIQPHVNAGRITYSTALYLVKVDRSRIEEVAVSLIAGKMSHAEVVQIVKGKMAKAKMGQGIGEKLDPSGAFNFKTDETIHLGGGIVVSVKAFQRLSKVQIAEVLDTARKTVHQDV